MDFNQPLKLTPARVWRTYTGGKLLDELHGVIDSDDGHFPEEWMMSLTVARNAGREQFSDEGLSRLAESGVMLKEAVAVDSERMLGRKQVQKYGVRTGVLIKIIDSAERLTIQVHPNRELACKLFHSDYGKTECWHILGGRTIDGVEPCIYFGFRPGITRRRWRQLFATQDIPGMLDCLHRFAVKPGETFLIEGGVPHAIGAGCLLAEIQEPTDYSIRTERITPTGFPVADLLCHQGIGFAKMFDCFSYQGTTATETYRKWRIMPRRRKEDAGCKVDELVGYADTPCFKMDRLEVEDRCVLTTDGVFSGLSVLSGNGALLTDGIEQTAVPGDQFFIPAATGVVTIANRGCHALIALRYFGPDPG
jgi:mannose-6-phosphate isomerase